MLIRKHFVTAIYDYHEIIKDSIHVPGTYFLKLTIGHVTLVAITGATISYWYPLTTHILSGIATCMKIKDQLVNSAARAWLQSSLMGSWYSQESVSFSWGTHCHILSHNNEWWGVVVFRNLYNGHQDDKPYWGVRKCHCRKSFFIYDLQCFPSQLLIVVLFFWQVCVKNRSMLLYCFFYIDDNTLSDKFFIGLFFQSVHEAMLAAGHGHMDKSFTYSCNIRYLELQDSTWF